MIAFKIFFNIKIVNLIDVDLSENTQNGHRVDRWYERRK